jgi:predicted Zn-dependent peptidase
MFENVRITKLENGACVATSEMAGVNSCSVCFSMPMGGRREKAAEAGWSHFAEHMAFKGTAKYPTSAAINRALDRIGGLHNADTATLRTLFHTRVPAMWTAKAVDILGDMVANPVFPSAEIAPERKVILEEFKMLHDDPALRIALISNAALWPGHPLGLPIIGNEESLSHITAEALRDFHRRHYTAKGAMFVAAGKLNHDQIVDMVRPVLLALHGGSETSFRPASRCRPVNPLVFECRDVKQAHLLISFRAPRGADGQRVRMQMLADILGGGMGSRLFRAVRDKHSLAYSIGARGGLAVDFAKISIGAEVDAARIEKAVSLCGREIRKLADKPVGRRELDDVKNKFINCALLVGEDSEVQQELLESSVGTLGRVETTAQEIAGYESVMAEEVQSLASEIFRPENCSLALILPKDCKASPEKLREALLNG